MHFYYSLLCIFLRKIDLYMKADKGGTLGSHLLHLKLTTLITVIILQQHIAPLG